MTLSCKTSSCSSILPRDFLRRTRRFANEFGGNKPNRSLVFDCPKLLRRSERYGDFPLQRKLHRIYSSRRRRSLAAHRDSSFPARVVEEELPATFEESAAASSSPGCPPAQNFSSMVLSPPTLPPADRSFLLVGSTMIMMCGAFVALVATAIPTLNAMRRAALSLEKLADVAQQELPGTMAAIRLSGMEISDLTLELSDLSQEISESVRSSARAVRAAEVGIRRMGSAAASQTLSMLQEHASVPVEAVKPVVATAAETTRQAMTQAQRAVQGLAGMPVLSKWIQKKKFEEEKKREEDLGLESSNGSYDVDDEVKVECAS